MRELLAELHRLRVTGPAGRAVVVGAHGSVPRPPGAVLLATEGLRFAGSLAGGCVEGASVEEIAAVVRAGVAAVFDHPLLDRADPDRPVCGGSLRVLVEPAVRPELEALARSDLGGVLATVLAPAQSLGTAYAVFPDGSVAGPLSPAGAAPQPPARETSRNRRGDGDDDDGDDDDGSDTQSDTETATETDTLPEPRPPGVADLPLEALRDAALAAWTDGVSRCVAFGGSRGGDGDSTDARAANDDCSDAAAQRAVEVFLEVIAPRPRLVLWGATDVSAAMLPMARALGWWIAIADARAAFVDPDRFADADVVLRAWPEDAFERIGLDARTAVCIQTHDPKLDEPALAAALRSAAGYVGLMGSRRTQARHRARLEALGFADADIARVHGPIGLDLGGHEPAEIAVAILAEIVAARRCGTGRPLAEVRCGNTQADGASKRVTGG